MGFGEGGSVPCGVIGVGRDFTKCASRINEVLEGTDSLYFQYDRSYCSTEAMIWVKYYQLIEACHVTYFNSSNAFFT
jgi:hypothetical protein